MKALHFFGRDFSDVGYYIKQCMGSILKQFGGTAAEDLHPDICSVVNELIFFHGYY